MKRMVLLGILLVVSMNLFVTATVLAQNDQDQTYTTEMVVSKAYSPHVIELSQGDQVTITLAAEDGSYLYGYVMTDTAFQTWSGDHNSNVAKLYDSNGPLTTIHVTYTYTASADIAIYVVFYNLDSTLPATAGYAWTISTAAPDLTWIWFVVIAGIAVAVVVVVIVVVLKKKGPSGGKSKSSSKISAADI